MFAEVAGSEDHEGRVSIDRQQWCGQSDIRDWYSMLPVGLSYHKMWPTSPNCVGPSGRTNGVNFSI